MDWTTGALTDLALPDAIGISNNGRTIGDGKFYFLGVVSAL